MSTTATDPTEELSDARRRVEAWCQSLVDAGDAHWRVRDDGRTELHMASGETFLFGDSGVTRLKPASRHFGNEPSDPIRSTRSTS